MKYTVTVTIVVDPLQYEDGEDSPTGALQLVNEMLSGAADIPFDETTLECDNIIQQASEI